MSIFDKLQPKRIFKALPEKGPAWKPGMQSRALIGCDGDGNGALLAWIGESLEYEIDGIGKALADLGLDDAPEGLSIWEGTYVGRRYDTMDGTEYETEVQGTFRDLTDEEWDALKRGDDPWNPDDWFLTCQRTGCDHGLHTEQDVYTGACSWCRGEVTDAEG
jgi:hypothetical protein